MKWTSRIDDFGNKICAKHFFWEGEWGVIPEINPVVHIEEELSKMVQDEIIIIKWNHDYFMQNKDISRIA